MASSILRYPLKAPVEGEFLNSADAPTGRIDYLRIQRCRINYDKSDSGYGGTNLPGNNVAITLNPQIAYLAMPPSITTSYQADYQQINMGGLGVLASQVVGALQNGGAGSADQITASLQAAASSAFPEIAYNKGASIAQSIGTTLGLETGVTGNALQALTKGRIMNPFTEQVFNGVQFRNHQFTMKMFARNKSEAESILSIIRYLKEGTLPLLGNADETENARLASGVSASNGSDSATSSSSGTNSTSASLSGSSEYTINKTGRFLQVPDRFLLEFVRLDSASDTITKLPHYKFQPCVCTNVSVNYTPDGQYVSFKDLIADLGSDETKGPKQLLVPAVEIGLSFAETRILTQSDALAGF